MGAYFFHFLFHAFNFQDLYVVLNVFRMYYHETVFVQQQQSKPCFYLEKKQGDIMMGSFDEGGLCFFLFVCWFLLHIIFFSTFFLLIPPLKTLTACFSRQQQQPNTEHP